MPRNNALVPPAVRYRLGRRRPTSRGLRLSLAKYLERLAAPVAPTTADYGAPAMTELDNIYLNDQLGDCVIAAGYHMVAVATGNAGVPAFLASSAQLIADYSAIGGYVPGNPKTDNGCDEITALNYWLDHGFADGTKGAAWIAIDATKQSDLEAALYLFENVFLTFELPDAYYGANGKNAPNASGFTWDVAGAPNPSDGHAVVSVGYNSTGMTIDTWGMLGTWTWPAIAKYCTDSAGGGAYAMLTPDILIKGQQKSPGGVDWTSLLQDIDSMGSNIPVVNSSKAVSAVVNQALTYQITATNTPTSYSSENLPVGLAVNKSTGAIIGKPTTAGTVQSTVVATNATGSGGAIVSFTIKATPPGVPAITSAKAVGGTVGKAFSYKITASNSPTSFGAAGLPAGLTVNATTGAISGTPTAAGAVQVTVSASNAGGTGKAVVTFTIKAATPQAPAITSAKAVSGTIGKAISFKITASNSPTSFGAAGLPAGLTVNATTGAISGTPTAAGVVQVTVSASNAGGTGKAVVTFTIKAATPQAPAITSAKAVSGTIGKAISYKITASNSPTSFGAAGLPAGLTVNATTGAISGTPTAAGVVQVTVSASNAGGTGKAVVTFTIKATPPPTTPPHTTPPHTTPPHTTPPHTTPPTTTPPASSSGIPPTSGESIRFKQAWVPPPTYAVPPVPAVPPMPATAAAQAAPLTDLGRQFLGAVQGSRKLGILAASGIVIQGLLAIVTMTDEPEKK